MSIKRNFNCYLFTISSLLLMLVCQGQNQSCLNFDGHNDYVAADNYALNQIGSSNFTIEAWIKGVEDEQRLHPMIFSNRPTSNEGILFFFHSTWGSSQVKMLCVQLNGHNYMKIDNGTFQGSILDGNFHHVAATKSDSLLKFYIDGNYIGKRLLHPNTSVSSSNNLWIGQDKPTNNTFKGSIGNVRIWNYARSELEIQANMHNSMPLATQGLLANWELNEGVGQIVIDKTNNANGTLGNSIIADENDPTWEMNCNSILNNITSKTSLTIKTYPSPSSDDIYIELPNYYPQIKLSLINTFGQIVYTNYYASSKINIDVHSLKKGLYFINLELDKDNILQTRFIKD